VDHRAGLDRRKISPPPGFNPRNVQPVAQSLYRLSYTAHTGVVVRLLDTYALLFAVCTCISGVVKIHLRAGSVRVVSTEDIC
jgi:hypothetical protein